MDIFFNSLLLSKINSGFKSTERNNETFIDIKREFINWGSDRKIV